ncbi:MAG TPA: DUF3592 domain-containing protein [Pseudomonas sp.]|nr:DUF3592 domain-containing protein [Pseudomonas sp.]
MKLILKICGFIVVMYFGVMQALEMGSARTWPSVTGTITRSHIDSTKKSQASNSNSRREYRVRAAYDYQVAGAHFTGNRIEIRPTRYSMRQNAERELADYPVGKTVTVYYDPENPEKSVLKR